MWSNSDHRIVILPPGKGFYTPSAASSSDFKASSPNSNSPAPMSEPRRRSPANGGNLFHAIHKVPSGNSPYVRAKQVQLIEKDPSRAISLFWSAINAGDRVDSALKDMAIVMKQLNRSDEAIEAIKSFRHLCPHDSQESLDNVLVELYKRAGRIEEEIEMLQTKLKRIEEGLAFGGRRTKTARSQGKKVHITMEEERSRILGNLAWAYLQQNNYTAAEEYYRRALAFEPDKNKECNLAICLMHMNRLAEARSLLHAVKASCDRKLMDESFAKSYERACEILKDFEAGSASKLSVSDKNSSKGHISPQQGDRDRISSRRDDRNREMQQHREFYCGSNFESQVPVTQEMRSPCLPYGRGGSLRYSRQGPLNNESRNGCFDENPGERRPGFHGVRKLYQPGTVATEPQAMSRRRNTHCSPAPTWGKVRPPFTQPRRCLWGFSNGNGDQRNVEISIPEQKFPSSEDWRIRRSWEKNGDMRKLTPEEHNSNQGLSNSESQKSPISTESPKPSVHSSNCYQKKKKSWADMAEEEDEELFNDCEKFKFNESPRLQTQMKNGNNGNQNVECYNSWNSEKEFNDENDNINRVPESLYLETQMKGGVVRKLDLFNIKDNVQPEKCDASPRNQPVKRSLCFDRNKNSVKCDATQAKGKKVTLLRRNRLEVFKDITRSP